MGKGELLGSVNADFVTHLSLMTKCECKVNTVEPLLMDTPRSRQSLLNGQTKKH